MYSRFHVGASEAHLPVGFAHQHHLKGQVLKKLSNVLFNISSNPPKIGTQPSFLPRLLRCDQAVASSCCCSCLNTGLRLARIRELLP